MLVSIVHYFYPGGGPTRFIIEMARAMAGLHPHLDLQFVGTGGALQAHQELFDAAGISIKLLNVKPSNAWAASPPRRVFGLPGTRRLQRYAGRGRHSYVQVPAPIFDGCDIVWIPWGQRHRVPPSCAHRAVATLHDLIPLQFEERMTQEGLGDRSIWDERETVQSWLTSAARLVVTSRATVALMREFFGAPSERFDVVRILAGHVPAVSATVEPPPEWGWARNPFLLCPANVAPHKNHGVLLEAVALWEAAPPLVLTGLNSDLPNTTAYGARRRQEVERAGLQIDTSVFPLGYVSDDVYFGLLTRAWAVVMPTLAEGGGNFPVLEAMLAGIPVVCSDIPVMREQIEETGGQVLWFNPHDPQDLLHRFRDLYHHYNYYKSRAVEQIGRMRVRTWTDVAAEYETIMLEVAAQSALPRRGATVG